jgi:hypothetical protein
MRKWLISSVVAFAFAAVCAGGMSLFASHMVASEREWAEANVRPSAVQEFAVALARWCRNYWYVGGSAIVLMVLGLAVLVMVGTTRRKKRS